MSCTQTLAIRLLHLHLHYSRLSRSSTELNSRPSVNLRVPCGLCKSQTIGILNSTLNPKPEPISIETPQPPKEHYAAAFCLVRYALGFLAGLRFQL